MTCSVKHVQVLPLHLLATLDAIQGADLTQWRAKQSTVKVGSKCCRLSSKTDTVPSHYRMAPKEGVCWK